MNTPFRLLAACVACLSFSAPSLAEQDPAPQAEQKTIPAALKKAIWDSDVKLSKAMIEAGIDVKSRAIHEANALKIVKSLIASGADVNAKNEDGETALHMAVSHTDLKMIKALLKAGADVHVRDSENQTAMMIAMAYGIPGEKAGEDVAIALIDAGADLKTKRRDGEPLLVWAASMGYNRLAQKLLAAGSDVNEQGKAGFTALMYATVSPTQEKQSQALVQILLQAGADVHARDQEGITALMCSRYPSSTKLLLKAGADLNAQDNKGWTALHMAASNGHGDVVKALLKAGADPNVRDREGRTALFDAIQNDVGDEEWAEMEPRARAELEAIALDITKQLIAAGADPNAKNAEGQTPLMQKTYGVNITKALIKAGADVNAKDAQGLTALMIASRDADLNVMKALIQAGADVGAKDNEGKTALDRAQNDEAQALLQSVLKAGER